MDCRGGILSYANVVFLPPNTTSKAYFRRELIRWTLNQLESSEVNSHVDVRLASWPDQKLLEDLAEQ